MKKIDTQKIKTVVKTHAPAAITGAVVGGAATLYVWKRNMFPMDKDTLFLSEASRKLLVEGQAIGFDLMDYIIVAQAVKKD